MREVTNSISDIFITADPVLIICLIAAVAGGLGWLIARLHSQRKITQLETTLHIERQTAAEQLAEVEKTFAVLSNEALRSNSQTFLQLAQETLKRFQVHAKGELEQKERAVENLVKPIRETLEKAEQQMRLMENERKQAYGALHKHLETLTQTQQTLHSETRNLVQALRRPEVRGQWGEMTLKRLVELAGMVDHCDFYEQQQATSAEGQSRPDMIVRMPDERELVVDAKTPLDAYLSAIEAPDDETRNKYLLQHARNVRARVRELSAKTYWAQFRRAPDFVVLFIPGEQFLGAALDVDRDLLEHAMRQRVILTTPTSLIALLRAVGYGWRQQSLATNAERIRETGEDLYNRLATFSEHLSGLGRSLDRAVSQYNQSVGSFQAKVMPGARKFTELGVTERKAIEEPEQIEKGLREVES
ncbi:MAG: DNA recombination protein RmuC [Gammaproteobacteria bacterium]|jgi:DNA recombination protein RmuC|nr:DNA recombination protein RmuC [Gammaproteobacteria bacterium]